MFFVEGAVWAFGVVGVLEFGELVLEFGECRGGWLGGEPFLLGLVESFDFSLGLWVSW